MYRWFHERSDDEDRERRDGGDEEKENEEQPVRDAGDQLPLAGDAVPDVVVVVFVFVVVPGAAAVPLRDDDLQVPAHGRVVGASRRRRGRRVAAVRDVVVGRSRLVNHAARPSPARL